MRLGSGLKNVLVENLKVIRAPQCSIAGDANALAVNNYIPHSLFRLIDCSFTRPDAVSGNKPLIFTPLEIISYRVYSLYHSCK